MANVLYGIQKQQLKHLSKSEYLALRELVHLNKNIYNVALYNTRQHFFVEGKLLNYNSNYHLCKLNENYELLNANQAQQTIKRVQSDFKSFFALLKLKRQGKYTSKVVIPKYLDKDGFASLTFGEFNARGDTFTVPMSSSFRRTRGKVVIKIPSNLKDKKIKEVRIVPKSGARFFEIQWVYEIQGSEEKLNTKNTLAIDLGVNNLLTCVTNSGNAFIIDGQKVKSINQWANKENARLQNIKDLQGIEGVTKKQQSLWTNRNNKINDYINKAVKYVINYCGNNDIGSLVIGYNNDVQRGINIGRANNQSFVNIPIAQIRNKLNYMCQRHNIEFVEQEESYTSKADFLSNDPIPIYGKTSNITHIFSGKRVKRGLYKSKTGVLLNSDINGALNIMKKANICKISLVNNAYLSPGRIIIK